MTDEITIEELTRNLREEAADLELDIIHIERELEKKKSFLEDNKKYLEELDGRK